MKIEPAKRFKGTCTVPGDKSISHRAALIASLAKGSSQISNYSNSDDCGRTLSCLEQLGISVTRKLDTVRIDGNGLRSFMPPKGPLNCGNSGTTMRLLAGILSAQPFQTSLTGDASLSARPMRRIIEPLERMGAQIESADGRPPIRIKGSNELRPITYSLPLPSAQVKSGVLLAGLHANGKTEVIENNGITRDHTERLLRWFGVPVNVSADEKTGRSVCGVTGPASFSARDVTVPGDFSAAAFFIAAAALIGEAELQIENVGLNSTRTQFLDVLRTLGAQIDIDGKHEESKEPVGNIRVGTSKLAGDKEEVRLEITGPLSAALIDELPLLAVVGTQLSAGLIIREARELRLKETDRITATARNLKAMGAAVEEFEDGLRVLGGARLKGARLDSFGDHRIAMAFAIAALIAEGESEIVNSECVSVSFPNFFETLAALVER